MMRAAADRIESGNCPLSQEQYEEVMDRLAEGMRVQMTAEQCCSYLQCSRTSFDKWVRDGVIPKGRKIRGMSSLIWYKDQLKRP